jgi:hypothetical protein
MLAVERGRLEHGQAGHRGAGSTTGTNPPGVVHDHGSVVAGYAKVDPQQTNRRWQVHGGSFHKTSWQNRLGRLGDAPTTATVPGHLA